VVIVITTLLIIFILGGFIQKTYYKSKEDNLLETFKKENSYHFTKAEKTEISKIKNEYILKIKNKNDVFNLAQKKYCVYFSKKDCPYCEMIEPVIENHILKYSSSFPIYFIDAEACMNLGIFVSEETKVDGYSFQGVPALLVIEQDRLISSLSGIEEIQDYLSNVKF